VVEFEKNGNVKKFREWVCKKEPLYYSRAIISMGKNCRIPQRALELQAKGHQNNDSD
jgi:hypothetical protein